MRLTIRHHPWLAVCALKYRSRTFGVGAMGLPDTARRFAKHVNDVPPWRWQSAAFRLLSRDSQLDQRKRAPLEIEGVNGLMDCGIECIGVGEGLMREMMRLEVAPDAFDVV